MIGSFLLAFTLRHSQCPTHLQAPIPCDDVPWSAALRWPSSSELCAKVLNVFSTWLQLDSLLPADVLSRVALFGM